MLVKGSTKKSRLNKNVYFKYSRWHEIVLARRNAHKILVSVVCSIMKLFKFAFKKNFNFLPQDT
jgi:hypothetical protein